MTDKELIKEVATLAAASYMATEKTRSVWTALIMSTMLPTATATSTTTAASTSSTAWDDMTWFFTMIIGVIIAERVLMQSFRLWWRHLFGSTTSASTTSTAMDMDVDNSDDQMDVDEACIADTTPVPDVNEFNEIKMELEYYKSLSLEQGAKLERARELCDNRWRTIEQLTRQLEAERARRATHNEVHTTSATGKVYHSSRSCYHIRTNSSVKTMRPCKDCCG